MKGNYLEDQLFYLKDKLDQGMISYKGNPCKCWCMC